MSEKIVLNEESKEFKKIKKEWNRQAREIKNQEELVQFIDHILNDYKHDYGTTVRAISAMILATASMGADLMGITIFQDGIIMWDFILNWMYTDNKTGLKIVDYDNMLYPQYEDRFQKTISKDVWKDLRKEAKHKIKNEGCACERVVRHWQSIVEGVVPFGYEVKDE